MSDCYAKTIVKGLLFVVIPLCVYATDDVDLARAPRPPLPPTSSQVHIAPVGPDEVTPLPRDLNVRDVHTQTLEVDAVARFSNFIVAPGVANDFIVDGDLEVKGNLNIDGNFNVTGTSTFSNTITTTAEIELAAPAGKSACIIFLQSTDDYEKARICSPAGDNQAGITISVSPAVTNSISVDATGNTTISGFLTGSQGAHLGTCGVYTPTAVVQFGTSSMGTTDSDTCRQVHTVLQSLTSVSSSQVDGSFLQVHVFPLANLAAGSASSGFFIANLRNSDKSVLGTSASVLGMIDIPSSSSVSAISMSSCLAESMESIYLNSSFTLLTVAQQAEATTLIAGLGYTLNTALVFVIVYTSGTTPANYTNRGILQTFAVG